MSAEGWELDLERLRKLSCEDLKEYKKAISSLNKRNLVNRYITQEQENANLSYSLKVSMSTINMLRSRIDELSISYKTLVEKVGAK